jgi:hypothetical protein
MAELLLELSFDEPSGDVIDHSGNGRNFALSGSTVRTADGEGHTGRGLTQSSPGVGPGPAIAGLHPATWTWMSWVRITASVNGWVGESYWSTNDTGVRGLLYLSGSLNFRVKNPSNVAFESAGLAPDFGNWHHIAATYDGTSLRTYRDGVQVGSAVTVTGGAQAGTALRILDQADTAFRIDDFRIFDGTMDATEIATWAATPAGPDEAEQVELHVDFESATADLEVDSASSVGLDATFSDLAAEFQVESTAEVSAEVTFAAPMTQLEASSVTEGNLLADFPPAVAGLQAEASAQLELTGGFAAATITLSGGTPSTERDIEVQITVETSDPITFSVPADTIQVTGGDMRTEWWKGSEDDIEFSMTLSSEGLTVGEVEGYGFEVAVATEYDTPTTWSAIEPDVSSVDDDIRADFTHLYEATTAGARFVFVRMTAGLKTIILLATKFVVLGD